MKSGRGMSRCAAHPTSMSSNVPNPRAMYSPAMRITRPMKNVTIVPTPAEKRVIATEKPTTAIGKAASRNATSRGTPAHSAA